MKVVINIEANGLKPTHIWCIVCKSIETGAIDIFRNVVDNEEERSRFLEYSEHVTHWIGHNFLNYDGPVLSTLLGIPLSKFSSNCIDTLIISKMVDYSRKGHSTSHYAEEFSIDKPAQPSYVEYSEKLVDYCVLLVNITEKIYDKYRNFISRSAYQRSIALEHDFQLIVNDLHNAGFNFNKQKAEKLLLKVEEELKIIDEEMNDAFPPREVVIREFVPKLTKYGTINRSSVPRVLHDNLHLYEAGQTYKHTKLKAFNASSHKQIIEVLHEAGWSPVDKTQTHIDKLRELNALKRAKRSDTSVDTEVQNLYTDLYKMEKSGWKINETNLATLPPTAPPAARLLAKRILLESRRRTFVEWLSLVREDSRVHGKFYSIGAWTHRMAHQQPNTANIPKEFKVSDGSRTLLGKEMRSLWCAPKGRLLVGADAEGIQLRIFAHYINEPAFTKALIEGRKEDKTDVHSSNQIILGKHCKTREAAKHSLYAYLLGGGWGKMGQIMACTGDEAKEAYDNLLDRYKGFQYLKEHVIPADAKRGWFYGIDGRPVRIPGDEMSYRRHLAMSGYLQNGEAVVVKNTILKVLKRIDIEEIDAILVNIVHDEVIFEIPNDVRFGEYISNMFHQSIKEVGEELKLNCPLAGDGHVGLNWYQIH